MLQHRGSAHLCEGHTMMSVGLISASAERQHKCEVCLQDYNKDETLREHEVLQMSYSDLGIKQLFVSVTTSHQLLVPEAQQMPCV